MTYFRQTPSSARHGLMSKAMLASALMFCAIAHAGQTLPGYSEHLFELPADSERLLVIDRESSGLSDLLVLSGDTFHLYRQHPDHGFDFSSADASLSLPGRAVGWDLSRHYRDSRGTEGWTLLALIDGERVSAWPLQDEGFGPEQVLLEAADGFLSPGIHPLNFSTDITGNGLDDLIIPGAGELLLRIRNVDGSYQPALSINTEMRLSTTLHSGREFNDSVGQSVTIPMLQLRDVNADGYPDLIADTAERLDVFLANGSGSGAYFPTEPTFSVDRLAIRERLGEFDIDQLDFSNLTGALALTHEETLQDVTGNGIDDLILREGGRIALYLGREDGISLETPHQILRSGGNVLTTFLHDENDNGRPDLWLWRVEQVSVGDLFLWLAVSGSVNIEAFVYHNEGDSFARRPGRRITVTLRFPSAVRMISSVMDIRGRAREMEAYIPTVTANLGNGELQDLLVLLEDQVQLFRNAMTSQSASDDDRFLASLDYSRSRDNYEIDIRRLISEFEISINQEVRQLQAEGRSPDASHTLPVAQQRGDIMSTDLNGDGLDDVIVFLERNNERVSGILLLSGGPR
jgi:hypothetical protein